MPESVLIVKLDGRQAETAANRLARNLNALEQEGNQAGNSMDRLRGSSRNLSSIMTTLKGTIATLGLGLAARQAVQYADRWKLFEARIRGSTQGVVEFNHVQAELLRLSKDNGVALESTVKLFQDLQRISSELDASTDEVLELTDTVQKLGLIGGSTMEAMQNGLLQFSQGMAAGIFRAEEMNSILENMPEVAVSIAKGMKQIHPEFEGGVGALRRMVLEGRLLSKDVMRALQTQMEDVRKRAEDIPVTFGRAMTGIDTEVTRIVGQFDKMIGATGALGTLLGSITSALEDIGDEEMLRLAESVHAVEITLLKTWGELNKFWELMKAVDSWLGEDNVFNDLNQAFIGAGEAVNEFGRDVTMWDAHVEGAINAKNRIVEVWKDLPFLDDIKESITGAGDWFGELFNVDMSQLFDTTSESIDNVATSVDGLHGPFDIYRQRVEEIDQATANMVANSEERFTRLKNAQTVQVDMASRLIDLHKRKIITDEKLNETIANMAELMPQLSGELQGYLNKLDATSESTKKLTADEEKLLSGYKTEMELTRDYMREREGLLAIIEKYNGATEKEIEIRQRAQQQLEAAAGQYGKDIIARRDINKEVEKQTQKFGELKRELEDEIMLLGMSEKAQFVHAQTQKLGTKATDDQVRALQALADKLYDQRQAIEAAKMQTTAFAEAWGQALSRVDEAFVEMWKSIGKGFNSFADSLKDAFKQLLAELAHQAITKKITIQIGAALGVPGYAEMAQSVAGGVGSGGGGGNRMGLSRVATAAVGGGGATPAMAGGGGGGGGLLAGAGSLLKSGLGGLGGGITDVLSWMANSGNSALFGMGNAWMKNFSGTGGMFGLQGNAAVGAGALTNLGLGMAGGWGGTKLGESLFGKQANSSWGATAGGVIGSLSPLGPLGTLAGSAIGGLLDAAFGGDGKTRSNVGFVQGSGVGQYDPDRTGEVLTGSSGLQFQTFVRRGGDNGDNLANELVSTVMTFDDVLTQLTERLGTRVDFGDRTLSGTVADAGKTGEGTFFGLKGFNGAEGDIEGSVDSFVRAWLMEAESSFDEDFRPVVRRIVQEFGDSAQSMVNALEATSMLAEQFEDLKGITGDLFKRFGDNTEAMLLAAQAAAATKEQWDGVKEKLEEVVDATKDFNARWGDQQKVFRRTTMSAVQVWRDQGKEIIALSKDLNDIESFENLTNAIQQRYQMELQLIGQVSAALKSSLQVFTDTRFAITQEIAGLLDPTGQRQYDNLRHTIDTKAKVLSNTTDPSQIMALMGEIDSLTRQAFSMMTDKQKLTEGDDILKFLNSVEKQARENLNRTLDEISKKQGDAVSGAIEKSLGAVNGAMMREINKVFREIEKSIDKYADSTEQFSQAVDELDDNVALPSGGSLPASTLAQIREALRSANLYGNELVTPR